MTDEDHWALQRALLGSFIKSQRQLARLSLRELADRTSVSNPYLSQIERGIHEPSVRVLAAIAEALDLSASTLLMRAGLIDADVSPGQARTTDTPTVIRSDPGLTGRQKSALLAVYDRYQEANSHAGPRR